jgi:hypothetical protein
MLKRTLLKLSNDRMVLNLKTSPGLQAEMGYWIRRS